MRTCLDLTSYDATYIPKCTTMQKCFELVEKNLFKFPSEHLSLQTRNVLNHYKTHLAKSWLHYNEAIEYLEEIRDACRKKDFDSALDKADDFRYEIERAFEESDNALSASFGIILWEKENLEKQDVNMVKEEPLYATYVKLSDNARQIFSENYLGLDNYASNYRRVVGNVEKMRIFTNAEPELIGRKSSAELFLEFLPFSLTYYANSHNIIYYPVLSVAVNEYVELIKESETANELLTSLEKEKPDEFLRLLSDITGPKHSLASEFVKLVKEDALNRAFLNAELASIEKALEKKISEAKQSAEFFKSKALSYADENFMFNLQSLLNEPLAVSFEVLAFTSLADASKRAEVEIAAIESEFLDVKQDASSGRVTLGSRAAKLKGLNLRIEYIANSLDKLKESFYVLLDRCNKEVLSTDSSIPELILLKEKYINASAEKKLAYCSEFVEQKAIIKQNQMQRQENESKLEATTCYEKLKVLIHFVGDDSLIQRYNKLLDTNDVIQECNAILSAAEVYIREHYNISEIEELFKEVRGYNTYLEKFTSRRNKQFYELSSFFRSDRLMLEKAMPHINTLRWNITKLHADILQKTATFLAEYVKQHYSLKAFPLAELELSNTGTQKEVHARFILSFENPLLEFQHAFSIELPVASAGCSTISKSPNISSISFSDKTLTLNLKYLPKGRSFVELSCSKIVKLIKLAQHATMSSELGIISERYKFVSDATISRIKLRFSEIPQANARLVFRNNELPLVSENGFFITTIEDIMPNEKFTVNYLISKPLTTKLELISKKKEDDTLTFTYLCTVENRTAFEAKNAFVIIPLSSDDADITIFDERGKKLAHSIEPNGLKVTVDAIDPYSERMLYIKLLVQDLNSFKEDITEKIKDIIQELNEDEKFKREAEALYNALGRSKNASIERLQELYKQALDLKEKRNRHRTLVDQYNFLKNALQNAVKDTNAELTLASSLGLRSLQESLSAKLECAKLAIMEAESYLNTDIEKAIATLEDALKELQKLSDRPEQHIQERASELAKKVNNISRLLHSTGLKDVNSTRMVDAANAHYNSILDSLSKGRFAEATQSLNVLEQALADLNKYFGTLVESATEKLAEDLDFVFNVSKTYPVKIEFLKEQLGSVPQELLIEARYNPEFDESLLNTLSTRLKLSEDPIWHELETLLNSDKSIDALKLANTKKVHKKVSKIKEAYNELQNLETSLKKSAEYYVELLEKQALEAKSLEPMASKVREKLLGGDYMQALTMAKTALLTLNQSSSDIELYGVAFLAFLVLAFLIVRNARGKKQTKKFQKVLRNIHYV
jgi:archaellum component FlaC